MFAGVGSPLTHALGIGMNGAVSDEEFDRLEAFFRERGSPSLIDLCPMADLSVIEQVTRRGYKLIEFNNLMLKRLAHAAQSFVPPEDLRVVARRRRAPLGMVLAGCCRASTGAWRCRETRWPCLKRCRATETPCLPNPQTASAALPLCPYIMTSPCSTPMPHWRRRGGVVCNWR